VLIGSTVTLNGQFTDQGPEDTHTVSWTVVDSDGNEVATGNGQSFEFKPEKVGAYTATFTVTDDDTGTHSDQVSITVAGRPIVVVGPGKGRMPEVQVYNGNTGELAFQFLAFPAAFRGGVRVAAGDVNGDGIPDIVVGKASGGSQVRVIDGLTQLPVAGPLGRFNPFPKGNVKSVNVATADVDGDGQMDVIVGAGNNGSRVKVYSGKTGELIHNFVAYNAGSRGVQVAAGDVDDDGFADIITAPGKGGQLKYFSGQTGDLLQTNRPFGSFNRRIQLAAGDVNGDGIADVIAAGKFGDTTTIHIFDGMNTSPLQTVDLPNAKLGSSLRIGIGDRNNNGQGDLIVGAGSRQKPEVRILDGLSLAELDSFFAYGDKFKGGVWVAGTVM
jgi:hypothetical protein